MEPVVIKENSYYSIADIANNLNLNANKLINDKILNRADYEHFSYSIKFGYRKAQENYSRKKTFVLKRWYDEYMARRASAENQVNEIAQIPNQQVEEEDIIRQDDDIENQCIENIENQRIENDENQQVTGKYKPLPPFVALEDNEKFKDADGNILEVNTFGKKNVDNILFCAKDVARILEINKMYEILTQVTSDYIYGLHYETFAISSKIINTMKHGINNSEQIANDSKKVDCRGRPQMLCLTYLGLIKMLFTRRHKIARIFQNWAIKILFAAQMGNMDHRYEVASDILNVNQKIIKAFLNTQLGDFPCIYLIVIGTVGELRGKIDNLPGDDTHLVVKYGLTKNLANRMKNHETTFNKITKSITGLRWHVYIDPVYLIDAENAIRAYFKDNNFAHKVDNHREIGILPEALVKNALKDKMKLIGNLYAGKLEIIQQKLAETEKINLSLQSSVVEMKETYQLSKTNMEESHRAIITDLKESHSAIITDLKESHRMALTNLKESHQLYILQMKESMIKMEENYKTLIKEKDERFAEQKKYNETIVQLHVQNNELLKKSCS